MGLEAPASLVSARTTCQLNRPVEGIWHYNVSSARALNARNAARTSTEWTVPIMTLFQLATNFAALPY
jgi:hypothetical protein